MTIRSAHTFGDIVYNLIVTVSSNAGVFRYEIIDFFLMVFICSGDHEFPLVLKLIHAIHHLDSKNNIAVRCVWLA